MDESAAKIWIIKNQFGRRNLTPYQRAELALKLEGVVKEGAKENQIAAGEQFGRGKIPQNSAKPIQPIETRKELAKIAGISHGTIDKARKGHRPGEGRGCSLSLSFSHSSCLIY